MRIFLPAYTLYILQPLVIGVFGRLKASFQKHLHMMGQYDSSTVMAKKHFLKCYY